MDIKVEKMNFEIAMAIWGELVKDAYPMNEQDSIAAKQLFCEATGWDSEELWEEWHLRQDYSR
jgi:hypothetical protein